MNIDKFSKNDIIVRTVPSKNITEEQRTVFGYEGPKKDRSYLGTPLIFLGCANGMIYFQFLNKKDSFMLSDDMRSISMDIFDEGWEHYIDPKTFKRIRLYTKDEMKESWDGGYQRCDTIWRVNQEICKEQKVILFSDFIKTLD